MRLRVRCGADFGWFAANSYLEFRSLGVLLVTICK